MTVAVNYTVDENSDYSTNEDYQALYLHLQGIPIEQIAHTLNRSAKTEVLINRLGTTDLMKIQIKHYRDQYGLKPI
jgi:hypothetical protein